MKNRMDGESRPGSGPCLWSVCGGWLPQRREPTSWGDGKFCLGGSRCLWSAGRGQLPSSARAHQLGRRGVLPRRRSLPMEGIRGTAAPMAQARQLAGQKVPVRRRLLPVERLNRTAAPSEAGLAAGRTQSPAKEAVAVYGAHAGHGSPHRRGPTSWGERKVLPRRRSLPMERVWGTAARNDPGQPAGGTESPT